MKTRRKVRRLSEAQLRKIVRQEVRRINEASGVAQVEVDFYPDDVEAAHEMFPTLDIKFLADVDEDYSAYVVTGPRGDLLEFLGEFVEPQNQGPVQDI